eukprot:TRINITY_DN187_c0_g1_i1.p1 TRINITY_DN187_c0_g1~~TRINITY_DN187_c0_g1_i1.p1  ORF type:complete len:211 (+),score=24.06 TRINITY_DN187_c0_g1_i1:23-634(+)
MDSPPTTPVQPMQQDGLSEDLFDMDDGFFQIGYDDGTTMDHGVTSDSHLDHNDSQDLDFKPVFRISHTDVHYERKERSLHCVGRFILGKSFKPFKPLPSSSSPENVSRTPFLFFCKRLLGRFSAQYTSNPLTDTHVVLPLLFTSYLYQSGKFLGEGKRSRVDRIPRPPPPSFANPLKKNFRILVLILSAPFLSTLFDAFRWIG